MENTDFFDGTLAAQRIFKAVMNAFAHPMQKYSIAEHMGGNPMTKGDDAVIKDLCCTFLDNTVSYYVHDKDTSGVEKLGADIRDLTYARPAQLEDAGFVIVQDMDSFAQWDVVYRGTLVDPHKGATVIVGTTQLDGGVAVTAVGPGINGATTLLIDSGIAACLRKVAQLDIELPMGFDLLFVTQQGDLFAVPRYVSVHGEGF